MGIQKSALQALCYAHKNRVDFTNTLTIGRQSCYLTKKDAVDVLRNYDPIHGLEKVKKVGWEDGKPEFADRFFECFGAKQVDSMDYSDYEKATIIHDLNRPVEENLKNKYTLVYDGGSLEHVFNFPVAVKNCMDMVKVGGHLIFHTPANNYFGHGFYQFSPELFFALLGKHNSFSNTKIFMQDDHANWYEVLPFEKIGKRHYLTPTTSTKSALMIVMSQKIDHAPDIVTALQTHYIESWNQNLVENDQPCLNAPPLIKNISRIYRKVKQLIPRKIRIEGERWSKRRTHFKRVHDFADPF
jgi:SAM-dependent methyltransferase